MGGRKTALFLLPKFSSYVDAKCANISTNKTQDSARRDKIRIERGVDMANYPYMNYQSFSPPGGFQQNMGYQQPAGYQPQNQQGGGFVCRPVSSRAEAEAFPVDFMGAPMFFPDMSSDKIYLKRWNANTGSADFAEYTRAASALPDSPKNSLEEIREMFGTINEKLDAFKGGVKNE